MECLHELHARGADRLFHLNITEETEGDTLQGILRPLREPINGRAVDQRWEVTDTATEGLSDWREAKDDMKLLFASLYKEGEELAWGAFWASVFSFGCGANKLAKISFFICCKQVGDFTSVQDVVNIFKETFFLDLGVGKNEGSRLTLTTAHAEKVLHVVTPFLHTVVLLNLDLVDLIITHLRG
jgi:hypothetical protein